MAGKGRTTLKLPDVNKNYKEFEGTGTILFTTSMEQEAMLLEETHELLSEVHQLLCRVSRSTVKMVSLQTQLDLALQTHSPQLQSIHCKHLQAVSDAFHTLHAELCIGQTALRRAFCSKQKIDSTDQLMVTLPNSRSGVSDLHKDDVDSKKRWSLMVYNICHNNTYDVYRPELQSACCLILFALNFSLFFRCLFFCLFLTFIFFGYF
jgi:hypothetical protein